MLKHEIPSLFEGYTVSQFGKAVSFSAFSREPSFQGTKKSNKCKALETVKPCFQRHEKVAPLNSTLLIFNFK